MNKYILAKPVQQYICEHINADGSKIALAKPVFENITSAALAGQITAKKKCINKLPTWFNTSGIYYPPLLAVAQSSSEIAANYKANLAIGNKLIDLTAGFGIDSYYFAKKIKEVFSCEINTDLCEITAHNAKILNAKNINFIAKDGIEFLKNTNQVFDTIYLDPARRNSSGKVFKLKDCTPDVTQHLALFLSKTKRVIIKTSTLLDITAGLAELKNVSEIYVVSIKNECKELLWVIDKNKNTPTQIICTTLNQTIKTFAFTLNELLIATAKTNILIPTKFLYEPDTALLKSGAFNLIAQRFGLQKLHQHTHLYFCNKIKTDFLGRIFEITTVLTLGELKKEKELVGNVIVRNFPERAENLVKKYRIKPSNTDFILFTQNNDSYMVIKAKIIQHY